MTKRQYLLMVLDGVGINESLEGNAFRQANTPNIDRLLQNYPHARIKTSGEAVGLPEGQMGNSEVGHTNIGSGRVVYQELTRISKAIIDGDFFANPTLLSAINHAKKSGQSLHLVGLLSDGGVHSHQDHLYALLEMAKKNGVSDVFVHVILDGRDTLQSKGLEYVRALKSKMSAIGVGRIASVGGRFFAMDRDNRWDRVESAYLSMTGRSKQIEDVEQYIADSYTREVYDEFVEPACVSGSDGAPLGAITAGDAVVYYNFRPDRARELTRAFVDSDFQGFDRQRLEDLVFVTMTQYDESIKDVSVAYAPQSLQNTLGEYLSKQGLKQLRIAETEKYAHVTFFFNGGRETPYEGEDRILVKSPQVATYDLQPEMSAYEVKGEIIKAIESSRYDVIIVNFANGDMVGHTGDIPSTISAVEALDECVGRIVESLQAVGGEAIITADHGNCEYMIDPVTRDVITSHSTFDVPIIVVSDRVQSVGDGRLCDISPTLLALMGESQPIEMTGENLLVLKEEK
jgi:2,3-bisphosphoglycerate-independent phosphoglycerate mutase